MQEPMSRPTGPLHLIANARSGRGRGPELIELARRRCEQAGRKLVVHAPRDPADLAEQARQARQAARRDQGVVIAAGGDGTIRTVANELADSDVPMAVVPIGTFNFFARNHHVPEDMEGALDVALNGTPSFVTLGEVNGEHFLVNASIGLYARAIREREQRTSRFGRHRIVAIISTVLSILSGHRALDVELDIDGHREHVHTPTIFVGNNALQLRHVSLDVARCMQQKRLAVVTMKPVRTLGLLRLALFGLMRRLQQESSLQGWCARTLTVSTRRHKRIAVAVDGEMLRVYSPLVFRSKPGALLLLKPDAT